MRVIINTRISPPNYFQTSRTIPRRSHNIHSVETMIAFHRCAEFEFTACNAESFSENSRKKNS